MNNYNNTILYICERITFYMLLNYYFLSTVRFECLCACICRDHLQAFFPNKTIFHIFLQENSRWYIVLSVFLIIGANFVKIGDNTVFATFSEIRVQFTPNLYNLAINISTIEISSGTTLFIILGYVITKQDEIQRIMDDGKRENSRIKRSKNEVKNVLSVYLHRRNYNTMHTFESTKSKHLTYSAVERAFGRANSILYSCYNSDPVTIDHNFTKFLIWLRDQKSRQIRCCDIEQVVGPLFCHLYLEILRGGHTERAASFFNSHLPAIDRYKCDEVIKNLIQVFGNDGDITVYKEKFRRKKTVVELSPESASVLKKFVLENCHVVFLQVLQTWFDFHITVDMDKNDDAVIVASVRYPKDSKFQKLMDAIGDLKKEPVPIFNANITFNKQTVCCGLMQRQSGIIACAENNVLRLLPIHTLDSILNQDDDHGQILLNNHVGKIYSVDISKTSTTLVTGSADHTVCIYDLKNMKLVRKCIGHLGPVYCVAISKSEEFVASGSMDSTARLWHTSSGAVLRIFCGHTQAVTCLEFHPNCSYLATGSSDRNIRLWCNNKATPLRLLHVSRGTIYSLAFSPCGKLLASASEDKKIRIWDLSLSKVVVELPCKDSPILKIIWNSDGTELCAGAVDGMIRVWNYDKTREHFQNNELPEPITTQFLDSTLLCIEYAFGTYGTLTI